MRSLLILLVLSIMYACSSEKIVYRDLPSKPYCPPERRHEALIPTDTTGVFTTTGTITLCYGTPFFVTGDWGEKLAHVFVDGREATVLSRSVHDRIVMLDDGTRVQASRFCFIHMPVVAKTFMVELASYSNNACQTPHYRVFFRAICREPQHKPIPPCRG